MDDDDEERRATLTIWILIVWEREWMGVLDGKEGVFISVEDSERGRNLRLDGGVFMLNRAKGGANAFLGLPATPAGRRQGQEGALGPPGARARLQEREGSCLKGARAAPSKETGKPPTRLDGGRYGLHGQPNVARNCFLYLQLTARFQMPQGQSEMARLTIAAATSETTTAPYSGER